MATKLLPMPPFTTTGRVNDFTNRYLNGDREYMQIYLASGCELQPWVTEYEFSNLYWVEVRYDHVQTIREKGSVTMEVPFKEWNGEWVDEQDTRYMLVTIIEENGIFKVSGCREK